jgi:SNF2 family DNA or RNA helicase
MHETLRAYTAARQASASTEVERFAGEFVLKLLKKRLFSSPQAFLHTLEKHDQSLAAARRGRSTVTVPTIGVLQRLVERVDDEDAGGDGESDSSEDEAIETTARLFSEPTVSERELLQRLKQLAAASADRADSKAQVLIEWLKDTVCPDGVWNDNRVLVFTEYRDTQKWLQGLLATEGLTSNDRLMVLYGGMDHDLREGVKAAFQAGPADSPVRILLATDAAVRGHQPAESLSPTGALRDPWNPNRLEQRNGRLDRHGQRRRVLVHHFVSEGFESEAATGKPPGDLDGDLEFLARAAQKVEVDSRRPR